MRWRILSGLLSIVLLGACVHMNSDVPKMDKDQLKTLLGNPDVVIVEAVRPDGNPLKIKGAVRGPGNDDIKSWAQQYSKDKTIVFYCP